jgi:hypothetical protein
MKSTLALLAIGLATDSGPFTLVRFKLLVILRNLTPDDSVII